MIWGDYHPSGWPKHQTAVIHAGNGKNFIYSNDTVNYVFTGTNPQTVVHAHEGSGVIHCENPHIVVYTSHHALPRYKLARLPAHQLLLGRLLRGCASRGDRRAARSRSSAARAGASAAPRRPRAAEPAGGERRLEVERGERRLDHLRRRSCRARRGRPRARPPGRPGRAPPTARAGARRSVRSRRRSPPARHPSSASTTIVELAGAVAPADAVEWRPRRAARGRSP